MPVVQFSIPAKPWESLMALKADNESANQAAKRLLLEAVGENPESPAPDPNRLEYLEGQVEYLAHQVEALGRDVKDLEHVIFHSGAPTSDRLDQIESDLKSLALQFSDRLYAVIQAQEKLALNQQPAPVLESPPAAASPTRLPKATKRKTKTEGETP